MIFAEKLKSERKRKGWSQEELAEKLFVSRQMAYPKLKFMFDVLFLLGV